MKQLWSIISNTSPYLYFGLTLVSSKVAGFKITSPPGVIKQNVGQRWGHVKSTNSKIFNEILSPLGLVGDLAVLSLSRRKSKSYCKMKL